MASAWRERRGNRVSLSHTHTTWLSFLCVSSCSSAFSRHFLSAAVRSSGHQREREGGEGKEEREKKAEQL